ILAAGAFSVELAASGRRADFGRIIGWMTLVHAGIGLGEAVITGLVVRFILLTRPDLIYEPEPRSGVAAAPARWGQVAAAGLAVARAVCVFLAPVASKLPDGLEFVVGKKLGLLNGSGEAAPTLAVPVPDYRLPLPGVRSLGAATAAAGVLGTLVVFG